MKFINDIVLNLILVTYPILVYFIYNCYRQLKCEKYSNILLDVSLFTSLYLCLKFANDNDISKIIIFSNIPILVSYLKKRMNTGILLSIIIIYYVKYVYDYQIILMIIKFISFLLIYIICKKKNDSKFITIISVIQGFFLSFEYFYYFDNRNILVLIIVMFIFYILPFLLLYLFNLTDNITNLYQTVRELEDEKTIKEYISNNLKNQKITYETLKKEANCDKYGFRYLKRLIKKYNCELDIEILE